MRIVVLESLGISKEEINHLAEPLFKGGHEVITYGKKDDEDALISEVSGADVIVIANMPLSGRVILSDEKLKMISVAFTGVDHVDMASCAKKSITVCNAAGYSTSSVAELAVGLMISLLRNIVPLNDAIRHGKTRAGFSQHELAGKTVGIIGTGSIGLKVAKIVSAFGCKVIAYSRTVKREVQNMGITYMPLDEVLSQSDIVSIHVPLNENTRLLLNKDKLSLMKPSSILINAARGPIVDYSALADALKKGAISGAGLDVFETEPPLSNHPLFSAPNVVLTPHIGFATSEAMERRAYITFDNIIKWLEGKPQNVVR